MELATSRFLKIACSALLLMSSASGYTNEDQKERKRVPIGEDSMSHPHNLIFDEDLPTISNDEQTERKRVPVGEDCMSAIEYLALQEERSKRAEENGQVEPEDEEQVINDGYINTILTHPTGLHRPAIIPPSGETVELEDGSVWGINPSDRYKTFNWLPTDIVIIVPNNSWFSSYMFKIINQNSGEVLRANLHLGPYYQGPFTHFIVALDHVDDMIILENGTIWRIAGHDLALTKQWRLNDTVIVGVNPGWDSNTRPNILINIRKLNYACVKCFN